MKHLLIGLAFLSLSCSKDDGSAAVEYYYTATLEEVECRGERTKYCITEKEYDDLKYIRDSQTVSEPCLWVSIRDINNRPYSGYLRSMGRANQKPNVCD